MKRLVVTLSLLAPCTGTSRSCRTASCTWHPLRTHSRRRQLRWDRRRQRSQCSDDGMELRTRPADVPEVVAIDHGMRIKGSKPLHARRVAGCLLMCCRLLRMHRELSCSWLCRWGAFLRMLVASLTSCLVGHEAFIVDVHSYTLKWQHRQAVVGRHQACQRAGCCQVWQCRASPSTTHLHGDVELWGAASVLAAQHAEHLQARHCADRRRAARDAALNVASFRMPQGFSKTNAGTHRKRTAAHTCCGRFTARAASRVILHKTH